MEEAPWPSPFDNPDAVYVSTMAFELVPLPVVLGMWVGVVVLAVVIGMALVRPRRVRP